MRKVAVRFVLLMLFATAAWAEQPTTVTDLIAAGNAAAHADRHNEAIAAYEQAMHLDPKLKEELLPKIGRQYLWSEQSNKAAELLGLYLAEHASDCAVRNDYALALSWSNQLGDALTQYERLYSECAEQRRDAALGAARTLRWMDRPGAADRWYRKAQNSDASSAEDVQLGLALDDLARDDNRRARTRISSLASRRKSPAAIEAEAAASLRLGLTTEADQLLVEAEAQGLHSRGLQDLRQSMDEMDRLQFNANGSGFNDADGTHFHAESTMAAIGFSQRGRLALLGGHSFLARDNEEINGRFGGGAVDYRANSVLALRGNFNVTSYSEVDFLAPTGEAAAVITPTDRLRFDLSYARITIADNLASLEHHLLGSFLSGGTDFRITEQNTFTFATDSTWWSEGNHRMRYRLTYVRRFEGAPRVTVSLPALLQTYDHGFNFALFSPEQYIEIGPQVNVAFRVGRKWHASAYGRGGGQKESLNSWQPLTTAGGSLERQLTGHWALAASGGWTNSSVASPTGFRRTSGTLTVTYRP